jgi:putative transposase
MSNSSENEKKEINGIENYMQSQQETSAPFEVAYVEYKQLDIFVGAENTRPWITLSIDKSTRTILAFNLSLNPPSFVSIMMVIRDCVKNHSRLPNSLVIHSGKEFRNMDLLTLAANYSMDIRTRPMKKFSYPCFEEIFSNIDRYIKNKITSIRHDFRNISVLTMEELKNYLKQYFITYDNTIQQVLYGMSPREAMEIQIYEGRRCVTYDNNFEILTCISPKSLTATLIPAKGIKINGIYYWSEELETLVKQQVSVKYDPQDLSIAYIYIENNWIKIIAL